MKFVLNHSFHIKNICSDKKSIYDYIMNTSEVKNGLNHVFIPMGGDFNYMQAEINYKIMDDIIKKFNNANGNYSNLHFFYSSPYCYIKMLKNLDNKWESRSGDFFPYISGMS